MTVSPSRRVAAPHMSRERRASTAAAARRQACGPPSSPAASAPASRPSASRFMSTLVSGGRVAAVITSQLSKPTTATSAGTARPISRSASMAPRAIWSLPQKSASGMARRREKSFCAASRPQASDQRPAGMDGGRLQPRFGDRLARAHFAQANRLEPLRSGDMGDASFGRARRDGGQRALRRPRRPAEDKARPGLRPARTHRSPAGRAPRVRRLAPVDAPRGDDESVDPLAEQLIDVPPLAHGSSVALHMKTATP